MFLLIVFCCGTPPSCLKVRGWWWWWVVGGGLEQFSVSPRPLVFGIGTKGLGPGLDNMHYVSHQFVSELDTQDIIVHLFV